MTKKTIEALLEALEESVRLNAITEAKKGYGVYTQEDARFQGAMYESITKHKADIRASLADAPLTEPLTNSYVQVVPDKCDRIVWRNHYYHLPIKPTQPVAVLQGWKLVPVEPTPEMVKKALRECGGIGAGSCGEHPGVDGDDMRSVYEAMLAAALAKPQGYMAVPVDALTRWRDAFAEELSAWDIDPPLHHVKEGYEEITAILNAALTPPAEGYAS